MQYTARTWFIVTAVCVLLAVVGVLLLRPYPTTQKGTSDRKDTTVSFEPVGSVRVNTQYAFPIGIQTGTNTVSAVELHVRYDPQYFADVTIEPGPFFDNPAVLSKEINASEGTALLTIGTLTPRQGEGVIATLQAVTAATATQSTTFSFGPGTRAAAVGEQGNVIRQATDRTFPINL